MVQHGKPLHYASFRSQIGAVNLTDLTVRSLKPGVYYDDKTPGFGIRIGKNRKTWIVVKGRGRVKRSIGYYPAVSLAEARQLAHAALGAPYQVQTAPTYPEALKEFLAQEKWRPKPRIVIEQSLRKHFPWTKAIDKITHQDVLAALEKVPTAGARSHALKDIRTFFNWCVPRHLSQSPAAGIKMPTYVPRARVLTDDELKRVWIASEQCGTFGVIVKLLLLTGQRRGEIAALQTSWISSTSSLSSLVSLSSDSSSSFGSPYNSWTITLPAEITKNGREHSIPISAHSVACLASRVDAAHDGKKLLFPARGINSSQSFNGWSKSKTKLDKIISSELAKNGLEDWPSVHPWTLHDLRRTFATGLASLGVPIHVTEKLLNHVSGTTGGIVGVYQRHSYWPEQVEAMKKWEAKVLSLVRG